MVPVKDEKRPICPKCGRSCKRLSYRFLGKFRKSRYYICDVCDEIIITKRKKEREPK